MELYDYRTDPGETKNLASEQPKVVAKLRALLAKEPEGKPQLRRNVSADTPRPRTDRAALFTRRDRNRDGQLTREEFLVNQPDPDAAPTRFQRFDRNGDGLLSREEFIHQGNAPQ